MKDIRKSSVCIFCGSQQFKVRFSTQNYLVRECLQCHLVQTAFPEDEQLIDELYDDSYFQRLVDRKPQELVYHQRTMSLIEQYKTSGKILEVGLGIGIFMELAHQHGWDVEGVDPSEATCRYVSGQLQLAVHHGYLEALKLPEHSFDVISLRHVLEHVPQPKAFIEELYRLLKDDGIICLTVPNFSGLHSRFEKERWFHLALPYHVAHYTARTLTMVLQDGHFEVVRFLTSDLSCSSYLVQISNVFTKPFKKAPRDMYMSPHELDSSKDLMHWLVSKETLFNELMAKLGLGEELVVVAKKTL